MAAIRSATRDARDLLSAAAPWVWAPLVLILSLKMTVGLIYISGSLLLIPIASHLALRYGRTGWWVVAVAGLPLCVEAEAAPGLSSRADVGAYFAALILGAWLLRPAGTRMAHLPDRLSPWVLVGLSLLPLSLGLGEIVPDGWLSDWLGSLRWEIRPYPLFFLLVCALGAGGAPATPATLVLAALAAIGVGLDYLSLPENAASLFGASRAELPGLGLVELRPLYVHYAFDSAAQLLAALGYFQLGRFLRRMSAAGAPPTAGVGQAGLIAAVTLVAFGGLLDTGIHQSLGKASDWLGAYYAAPLAGLLAGLYFRYWGIVALCFVISAFLWVDGIIRAISLGYDDPVLSLQLEQYLVVYGFGLLGIRLGDLAAGQARTLWSGSWARFIVLWFLLVVSVVSPEESLDLIWLTIVFFCGVAAAMALGGLSDRLTGSEIELRGNWLSLINLIILGALLLLFVTVQWQSLQENVWSAIAMADNLFLAGEVLRDEEVLAFAMTVSISLLLLWLLTSSLEKLLRATGSLVSDITTLLQQWCKGASLTIRLGQGEPEQKQPASRPAMSRLIWALVWSNRTLIALAVAAPGTLIMWNTWNDFREELAWKRDLSSPIGLELEHRADERRDAEVRTAEARAAFQARLTRAAERAMGHLPDVEIREDKYSSRLRSDWYPDPDDPQVRWRATAVITLPFSVGDTPFEQSVQNAVRVHVQRQEQGLFGLWLEGPLDTNHFAEEKRIAEALEQRIVGTAVPNDDGQ